MSLRHLKLFENFSKVEVKKVNEEYEKPSDFPGTPFKGSSKESAEKEAGATWNGYDKNGYPKYTNESAKELNDFMADAIANDKGVIITIGDKTFMAIKYKNGLYYYVKDINLEDIPEKEDKPVEIIKQVTAIKSEPIMVKSIPIIEPEKMKLMKITPLTVLIKGYSKKAPVRRDATGKKTPIQPRVGKMLKELGIGYAVENGSFFFNDFKGGAWRYNPESGESEQIAKLDKYKSPDKASFKSFLKKHNIKL